jgi:hypothetical protein
VPSKASTWWLTFSSAGAGVGDNGSGRGLGREVLGGHGEERAGGAGFEARGGVPGEDSAAEVVGDRVDEDARAVDEPDDGDIQVPEFVWALRAKTFGGLRRVDPSPRAKPSALTGDPGPGCWGGKDLVEALSKHSEAAQGDVPVCRVSDHLAHGGELGRRELGGCELGAGGAVVEAVSRGVAPGMVAGRGEADGAESGVEAERASGSGDGVEEGGFGVAVGKTVGVELNTEGVDEREEKSEKGEEDAIAALEVEQVGVKGLEVAGENIVRDDGTGPSTEPACRGGARDAEMGEEARVAFEDGEVAEAMVVGVAASRAAEFHGVSGLARWFG